MFNRTNVLTPGPAGAKPRFQPQGAFAREVRMRGRAVLAEQPVGRHADIWQWLRALATLMALAMAYGLLLRGGTWPVELLLAATCGCLTYLLVGILCHDASHRSLSRYRVINRFALFAGFALAGVSGALWGRRHVRLHHMFPNVAGTDIDADSSTIIRLSPHKPWRPWHRVQLYYALPVYCLALLHLAIAEDFSHLAKAQQEAPHLFKRWTARAEFALAKVIHIAWALVIPWLVLQPAPGGLLAGYLVGTGSMSLLFVFFNVGSHISGAAEFHAPDATGTLGLDWVTHQVRTSIDWSPESALAGALTAGVNAHTAHHVFPEAAHCHNTRLNAVLSECASKHGVRRNIVTFSDTLGAHIRHLKTLSLPPRSLC